MHQLLVALSTTISLLSTLTSAQASQSPKCYWPDKTDAGAIGFAACATDGSASQCCGSGDACLSNGLCFHSAQGSTYRGACTDAEWKSDKCASFCAANDDLRNGPAFLTPCPQFDTNFEDWKWWCGSDSSNVCRESDGPNGNSSIFNYPMNDDAGLEASVMGIAGFSISTTSPKAATASSSLSANAEDGRSHGLSRTNLGLAIGLGLGVPLLLLSASMAFLWWKERKRRIIAERLGFAGNVINEHFEYHGRPSMAVEKPRVTESSEEGKRSVDSAVGSR